MFLGLVLYLRKGHHSHPYCAGTVSSFVFGLLPFIPGTRRNEKTGVGLHGNWREEVDSKFFTYLLPEGGGVKARKLVRVLV